MRYFLGCDQSSHWYLIPLNKWVEWEVYKEIDEDDERSWNVPDFVKYIDGPHSITFTDPKTRYDE